MVANGMRLIQTKLNRPKTSGILIDRLHLIDRLSNNIWRPLTLLAAPAGYGKTTLVSAWLDSWEGPYAWLTLDESENDLHLFLAYLLAALQKLFPGTLTETETLLRAQTVVPLKQIVTTLINELNGIDQTFILVLDDYEIINEPAIHEVISELLHYQPASLHLVLISRQNPLLPLPRLRARNQITEIRAVDLCFNLAEVADFVHQSCKKELEETTVSMLHKNTEGWVTGLRLAVWSMRNRGDISVLLEEMKGANNYLTDYLISEVLAGLPPAVKDFLLKISILKRFCNPLCNALTGYDLTGEDKQFNLDLTESSNLFIFSIDEEKTWFRYHNLFRVFLKHQLEQWLTSGEVAILHKRAANWFEKNDFIEDALYHALASKDVPKAVQLFARHCYDLMNQDQWPRLISWLKLFPRYVIDREPQLLISEAWTKQVQMQLTDIAALLERAEALLSQSTANLETSGSLQAEIDLLRTIAPLYAAKSKPSITTLERVLTIIPQDYYFIRGYGMILLVSGLQQAGDYETAVTFASRGLKEFPQNNMFQTRVLISLCFFYWMEGDLENLLFVAKRCCNVSSKDKSRLGLFWGQYFEGCVHYQHGDLAAAEEKFIAVFDQPYLAHSLTFVHSSIGLASTYQAQGLLNRAIEVTESAINFMMITNNTTLLPIVRTFSAELAARQGRMADANQWAARVGSSVPKLSMSGFYGYHLALPKILLAQNTTDSLEKTASYLTQLLEFVRFIHSKRFLIEVLALQALLYQAQGNQQDAIESLAEAIELAHPSGFIRLFVDLGPGLQSLLGQLAENGVAPAYIANILGACQEGRLQSHTFSKAGAPQPAKQKLPPNPPDILTNREMDVLLLLAKRLTNKEIAQELGISVDTVKQHSIGIYRKLDVNNRRQAAIQARTLGILHAD